MRKWILAAAAAAIFVVPGAVMAQVADRDQIQSRGGSEYAEGQRRRQVQGTWPRNTPNGKVKVEVYPNSTLYKDKEELEALQLGAVQMLAPSNSKFGPIGIKEFEVFDLPLHPAKLAVALRKVTDGPIGKRLLKLLEPKGMIGLAYWDNGFKEMTANKPLHLPADYKGLKFRIQSSKVLEAQFRALGATPQVMAFSTTSIRRCRPASSTARRTRTSNIYTQKMHEVQKYMTMTNQRLYRLRGCREQEVLGRAAGRYSRPARKGDE